MPEFIIVAASNGITFKKSELKTDDDVENIYKNGGEIGHHRLGFIWTALLRKANSMQPTKIISVFYDILLSSLGFADHQMSHLEY